MPGKLSVEARLAQAPQFIAQPGDHAVPVAEGRLPQQFRSRVPWGVAATAHPAKIGRVGKQDHHGFAQRARQMRDRRIDRNDDVEQGDNGSGIGEIAQTGAEMDKVRQTTQYFVVRIAQLALKTEAAEWRILE